MRGTNRHHLHLYFVSRCAMMESLCLLRSKCRIFPSMRQPPSRLVTWRAVECLRGFTSSPGLAPVLRAARRPARPPASPNHSFQRARSSHPAERACCTPARRRLGCRRRSSLVPARSSFFTSAYAARHRNKRPVAVADKSDVSRPVAVLAISEEQAFEQTNHRLLPFFGWSLPWLATGTTAPL